MRWIAALGILCVFGCGSVTDPNANATIDAAPIISCSADSECPNETPVCGAGTCVVCGGENTCDGQTTRGNICRDDGQCVVCDTDQACSGPSSVCDMDSGTCRGCQAHDECASNVCDLLRSTCALPNNVVYVRNGNDDIGQCTLAAPCGTLGFASELLDGARRFLRVLPAATDYSDGFEFGHSNDGPFVMVAEGAVFDWNVGDPSFQSIAFEVNPSSVIYGGTFRNSSGIAIQCIAKPLTVVGIVVEENDMGIAAGGNECDVTVTNSTFRRNVGAAINFSFGTHRVERNVFQNNLAEAILVGGSSFLIRNNLVVGNGNDVDGTSLIQFSGTIPPGYSFFTHNTVVENLLNVTNGIVVDCLGLNGDLAVVGNIIHQNQELQSLQACGEVGGGGTGMRLTIHNVIDTAGGFELPETNTTLQPLFNKATPLDYTLAGDVGVDTGDLLFSPPDDFLGRLRPLGEGPDIGAFESQ